MALLDTAALGRTSRQYILAMSLVNLSLLVFQAYFIFYLLESGLSYLQMSVIYSVNLAFCAVLSLPMGNIADRYGRRRALATGIAVTAVSMLIYAFTRDFNAFLVAEVFWAFGWALINGSNEAWVYDQLRKEGRAAEGGRAFTAMMSISYVLGVVGGIIASALVIISLNMPFLGAAVIAMFCAVLVWRGLAENYGMETVALGAILADCLQY
jgi:MFS family permease